MLAWEFQLGKLQEPSRSCSHHSRAHIQLCAEVKVSSSARQEGERDASMPRVCAVPCIRTGLFAQTVLAEIPLFPLWPP